MYVYVVCVELHRLRTGPLPFLTRVRFTLGEATRPTSAGLPPAHGLGTGRFEAAADARVPGRPTGFHACTPCPTVASLAAGLPGAGQPGPALGGHSASRLSPPRRD